MASTSKIILLEATALTGDKDGDGVLLPAKSSGLIGEIVVSVCNAATTVTAKVQHSADKVSWYDLAAFDAVAGAAGAKLALSADPRVLQYVRIHVALAGMVKAATVKGLLWFANFNTT